MATRPGPAIQNLTAYQGDDFEVTVTLTLNGAVYDLTGATVEGQVRTAPADVDATVLADFTITVDTPADGMFTMALDSATTTVMTAPRMVYDVQVTDVDGKVTTFLAGGFTVQKEVTR